MVYDPALGRAARELAYQHSVIGGLVPQDRRAGLTHNGAHVWLSATTDLDALTLPEQATDSTYLGAALAQLPEHPNGLIGGVILFKGGL